MLLKVSVSIVLFLLFSCITLYGYTSLFIHSPLDGPLNYFQVFGIINKAAMNM